MKARKEKAVVDYSHEVRLIRFKPLRVLMMISSAVFLLIGFIGIFVPLLPTTPFILLAAALYARSSIPFYNWIMNHQYMGPPLRNWKERGTIDRKSKAIAITMILITIPPSVFFFIPIMAVKILVAVIGIAVVAYIASRPS